MYIIQHSECNVIVCSSKYINNIKSAIKECPLIEYIILMDSDNVDLFQSDHIKVISFQDLINDGKLHQYDLSPPSNDSISSIIYSSGSTGMPKGIYNTFERWNLFITHIYMIPTPLIRLSFLPLSHTTEKQLLYLTLGYGGVMVLSNGNMEKIFEEHQIVNPTMIIAPPRFYDQIYNNYQTLLSSLCQNSNISLKEAEYICKQEIKNILGNRMKVMIVGGASSSEKVRKFISETFGKHLYNAYGSTEAGAITLDGNILYDNQIKVVKCEELDLEDDNELGIKRGELWVKTNVSINEYYKNEEASKESIKDGWFITGDIVEYQNNKIQVIDRRKNVFKTSNGFYVSPTTIENELIESPYIEYIFIYGDSLKDSLIAIIVPNLSQLSIWCRENQIPFNIPSLLKEKHCINLYYEEINRLIQERNLPSHCIPSMIHITDDQWTPENGLMTPSNKMKRYEIKQKYNTLINDMYSKIDNNRKEKLKNELLKAIKGFSVDKQDYPLISDSLTAVQVWNVLKNHGSYININNIVNCSSLDNLLKDINIHDSIIKKVEQDLNIDIFDNNIDFDSSNLNYNINNILLTGATGFLGIHLLKDLIDHTKYKVYCLIRCSSEINGKEKLQNIADLYRIEHNFISDERIEVIKGDLSKDMLGLDNHEWEYLSKSIDTIIHCGASVNWISSYDELRSTNICGTVYLLKLSNYNIKKGFIYISSAITYHDNNKLKSMYDMLQENHYSLTKWVSESLVLKSMEKGIKGIIIRPGMITSHSITGASNSNDFMSRIIKGVIMMGSYYDNKKGLEMIPVDFVSKTIIDIIYKRQMFGKTINIRNPNLIYTEQFVDLLKRLDYNIKVKSLNNWIKCIENNPNNPMYLLISFIDKHSMKIEKDESTIAYDGIISSELINKCVEFLKKR